jgi:hypothetical protein
MNTGNPVQDADPRVRPEADDVMPGDEARPPLRLRRVPNLQPVQDIQELIDKLAAVTRQLRRPVKG